MKAYLPEGVDRYGSSGQQTSSVVELDLQLISQLLSMQLDHIAATDMSMLAYCGPRCLEFCGTSARLHLVDLCEAHQEATALMPARTHGKGGHAQAAE